jgi:hypothetical protein
LNLWMMLSGAFFTFVFMMFDLRQNAWQSLVCR